jgi:hypothetical protein
VALRPDPQCILTADNGTLELAIDGDRETAISVLDRIGDQFLYTFVRHVQRQFFDREYWFIEIREREYMLMRCTPPSTPPGGACAVQLIVLKPWTCFVRSVDCLGRESMIGDRFFGGSGGDSGVSPASRSSTISFPSYQNNKDGRWSADRFAHPPVPASRTCLP